MSMGTTVTCVCGSHGFVIVDAETGKPLDLRDYYATIRRRVIDPTTLKAHEQMDPSRLRMVCANPRCRRQL